MRYKHAQPGDLVPDRFIPLSDALGWLIARCPPLASEAASLENAHGRVLAAAVRASALPPRAVAAIDGQAVRAADTEGASDYAPLPVGGAPVVAGDPLPDGADAVIPYAMLDAGPAALAPVARGSGVLQAGHDAADGWSLEAGVRLTPLHAALLARLGHGSVEVVRWPRVAVRAAPAKTGPDVLGPLLRGLLAAQSAWIVGTDADFHILAGRSGPGADDDGARAFTSVFAHGVAIRPGETSAIGFIGGTPAILLPGDPLACATAFALLAAPVLRRMAGLPEPEPVPAVLARKIASPLGRCDAIRVRVEQRVATPTGPAEFGSLARALAATGLVLAPEGSEGYAQGSTVSVIPL